MVSNEMIPQPHNCKWLNSIRHHFGICFLTKDILEQLERLRSEDTSCRLMITHSIESYWIPSQKKTKSKLQI